MSWSMLIAKPRRLRATHEKIRNKMRLLKLLVGATMSKFAKCQTQANCQECPAVTAHLCDGRVNPSI